MDEDPALDQSEEKRIKQRKEMKSRQLTIYTILTFLQVPKSFKDLAVDASLSPSTIQWYKRELLVKGFIIAYDRVRVSETTYSDRYIISKKGKVELLRIRGDLTKATRRKKRIVHRYAGEIPWKQVELLLSKRYSLSKICKEMKVGEAWFWRRWIEYKNSEKRYLLLSELRSKGEIREEPETIMARKTSMKFTYPTWEEIELDLSQGKTLVQIASDHSINYEALHRRFGRYVRSGKRKEVTDKMVDFGFFKQPVDLRGRATELLSTNSSKKKK